MYPACCKYLATAKAHGVSSSAIVRKIWSDHQLDNIKFVSSFAEILLVRILYSQHPLGRTSSFFSLYKFSWSHV